MARRSYWLLLLGLAALPARAQTPAASPALSGPPLRIKQFRDDIMVDSQGRTEITITNAIQIVKVPPGMPVGQLPVSYNATLQEIEISDAYTLKADGRKIPVDPSAIMTQHAPSQGLAPVYTDVEQKVILFPNVDAGDTMVYTEKRRDKEAVIPGQFMMANYPNLALEADDTQITLSIPKSMTPHVDSKDMGQSATSSGDRMIYRWKFSNPTSQARPTSPVPRPDDRPHFRVSSLANYNDFAHAYAPLAVDKIAATPAIQKQADIITDGISDPRAQAKALYEWVSQHVRYVAIELGAGGFIPHDPDWTLTNAYGDCKDQAVLFASLLKAKNIPAELVLISTLPRYQFAALPVMSDFNHMIVWLPSLNLYSDTTMGTAAFGTLPVVDSAKPVVHVVREGTAMRQTPPIAPGDLTSAYKIKAAIQSDGRIQIDMSISATGSWAADLRRLGMQTQSLGSAQTAAAVLKLHNFPQTTGGQLIAAPTSALTPDYSISGNFTSARAAQQTNVFSGVSNALRLLDRAGDGPMGPLLKGPVKDEDDTLCYNARQTEDFSIDFGNAYHLAQIPADMHLKTTSIRYDTHWSQDGTIVSVHREFESKVSQPVCSGAVRAEAVAALAKIRDDYSVQTRLVAASGKTEDQTQPQAQP
jgi:transglutaminase-like putative cysteine protease